MHVNRGKYLSNWWLKIKCDEEKFENGRMISDFFVNEKPKNQCFWSSIDVALKLVLIDL